MAPDWETQACQPEKKKKKKVGFEKFYLRVPSNRSGVSLSLLPHF
jgi:hypothetical protein